MYEAYDAKEAALALELIMVHRIREAAEGPVWHNMQGHFVPLSITSCFYKKIQWKVMFDLYDAHETALALELITIQ